MVPLLHREAPPRANAAFVDGLWHAPRAWALWGCAAIAALYWLCLRLLFPGYFAPQWPSHVDFYLYAGMAQVTWRHILDFPRPAAFAVMKLLGSMGIEGVMIGSALIALASVLIAMLTFARFAGKDAAPGVISMALLLFLAFAHPQFYFDHRHDLPGQASLLMLLAAINACFSWARGSYAWAAPAAICAALFAFTKETYFLSAIVLCAALMVMNEGRRWRYAVFLIFLIACEVASTAWARHVNGPFIDPNAGANAPYRISMAPSDLLHTYAFYLARGFTVPLAVWVLAGLYVATRTRRHFIAAAAFVAAGLAAYVPLAVLPNHRTEEYGWAAIPFVLAPGLLIVPAVVRSRPALRIWATAAIAVVIGGCGLAYARHYGANSLRWVLDQEIIGGRIVASFPALDKLPPKSRVLVVGLDTPFLPWRSENYIASRFGRGRHWTVMVKPGDSTPSPGPLSRLTAPEFLNLSDFDAVAIYDADGRLRQIKHVGSAEAAAGLAPFVPGLRDALQTAEHQPQSYENWMTVASKCLDWGLWDEAQRYLRRADPTRAANDALWHIEFGRASAAMEQISDAERELAAAKNLIARIKPDAAVAQQASQLEHAIFTLRAQPVSTLVAVPPRINNPNAHGLGMVQLKWFTRPGRQVEIHVNAPDGQMLTSGQSTGQAWTGEWVSNGMEFFLQDVTDGRPLTPRFTLARVKIAVTSR